MGKKTLPLLGEIKEEKKRLEVLKVVEEIKDIALKYGYRSCRVVVILAEKLC